MHRFTALIVLLSGVIASCGLINPYAELRSQNRERLARVEIGMSKEQVVQIMGTETAWRPGEDTFSNPYKKEILQAGPQETYEVLYYYTDLDLPFASHSRQSF